LLLQAPRCFTSSSSGSLIVLYIGWFDLQNIPRGELIGECFLIGFGHGLSIWIRSITWWLLSVFNLAYTLPFTEPEAPGRSSPGSDSLQMDSLSGVALASWTAVLSPSRQAVRPTP